MISGMSESELQDLNRAVIMQIKDRRNRDARKKRYEFKAGDKVTWNGRNGHTEGTIVRVKRKKAICAVNGDTYSNRNWDVPLNMLEVA